MTVIRSLITVSLFLCFIALWVWAWRSERRTDFAAAARLPLDSLDEGLPLDSLDERLPLDPANQRSGAAP